MGGDGSPRVPVDYEENDCFAKVFSTHWAKAFKELLLAHADQNWDTDMPLDGKAAKLEVDSIVFSRVSTNS